MAATTDYEFRLESSKLDGVYFRNALPEDLENRIKNNQTLHHVSVLPPTLLVHCFVGKRNRYFCKRPFKKEEITAAARLADCVQQFFLPYRRRVREPKWNTSQEQAKIDLKMNPDIDYILQGLRNILSDQGVLKLTDEYRLENAGKTSHEKTSKFNALIAAVERIHTRLDAIEQRLTGIEQRLNTPIYIPYSAYPQLPPQPFTTPSPEPYTITCKTDGTAGQILNPPIGSALEDTAASRGLSTDFAKGGDTGPGEPTVT